MDRAVRVIVAGAAASVAGVLVWLLWPSRAPHAVVAPEPSASVPSTTAPPARAAWIARAEAIARGAGAPAPAPSSERTPEEWVMKYGDERWRKPGASDDCPPYPDDCEAGTTCALDVDAGGRRCVASDCTTSADCPAGWQCTRSISPPLMRCIQGGKRLPGEMCAPDPQGPEVACSEGLLCFNGECLYPCDPSSKWGCPAGHSCRTAPGDVPDELFCIPDVVYARDPQRVSP